MENGSEASRINRCLMERERRQHMKSLISKLFSLLPPQPKKMSVAEVVDHATAYVKQLQKKVEEYKQVKMQVEEKRGSATADTMGSGIVTPVLNIRDLGSILEVHLVTGLNIKSALSDIIGILQEEGAEIIRATWHRAGDMAICTILSQALTPRIGIATSSVHERLKSLIFLKTNLFLP